jgi:hypothetical protein
MEEHWKKYSQEIIDMDEKFITRPLNWFIGIYLMIVIGNATTGIINNVIDEVVPQVDNLTASLLGIIRFVLNFDGALIMSIVGFIIWLVTHWKNTE